MQQAPRKDVEGVADMCVSKPGGGIPGRRFENPSHLNSKAIMDNR